MDKVDFFFIIFLLGHSPSASLKKTPRPSKDGGKMSSALTFRDMKQDIWMVMKRLYSLYYVMAYHLAKESMCYCLTVKSTPRPHMHMLKSPAGNTILEGSGNIRRCDLTAWSRSPRMFLKGYILSQTLLPFSQLPVHHELRCSYVTSFCYGRFCPSEWGQVTLDWALWSHEPKSIFPIWNNSLRYLS